MKSIFFALAGAAAIVASAGQNATATTGNATETASNATSVGSTSSSGNATSATCPGGTCGVQAKVDKICVYTVDVTFDDARVSSLLSSNGTSASDLQSANLTSFDVAKIRRDYDASNADMVLAFTDKCDVYGVILPANFTADCPDKYFHWGMHAWVGAEVSQFGSNATESANSTESSNSTSSSGSAKYLNMDIFKERLFLTEDEIIRVQNRRAILVSMELGSNFTVDSDCPSSLTGSLPLGLGSLRLSPSSSASTVIEKLNTFQDAKKDQVPEIDISGSNNVQGDIQTGQLQDINWLLFDL